MSTEETVVVTREVGVHEALRRITRALTDRLPAVDTLPLIAEEARAVLRADTVVVGLREEDEFLRFRAVAGERSHELQGVRVRAADSVADRTLRTGAPVLVVEGQSEPAEVIITHSSVIGQDSSRTTDDLSLITQPLTQSPSIAMAPIVQSGETAGALLAMSGELAPPFTAEQLDLLALFADQAAAALASDETERTRAEQSRELSVLYKASHSVGASLNIQEILDSVLDAVCEHLDFQTAVVFLANDEQTHLFTAAERGLAEPDREVQLSTESPGVAQILATGRARILTRAEDMPEFGVFMHDERIRVAMVAPILSRAESHGLLVVTSPQPENFTENDLKLLEAVASHAGIAISNAWLYEDATQRAEHAGTLYDLSQRLNATLNSDHAYALAVESVLGLLNVDTAAILTYDARSGRLVCRCARGLQAERLLDYAVTPGQGVAGWVFEWETPQAVAHVAADPRNGSAPLELFDISSLLAVPMAAGERVLGVLLAATDHRRLFTVGEMELLYTVSNQAAVALSNADLYGQARSKAAELRRYFRRVARALGDTMQGDDVPRLFADLALALMQGSVCNVYRVEGDSLLLQASASDRGTAASDEPVPVGEGLSGAVARKGQHLAVEDLSGDARLQAHTWVARQRFASYLGVPLRVGRELRGVVEVFTHAPHVNMREEARLLAHFARLARVAERLPVPEAVNQ